MATLRPVLTLSGRQKPYVMAHRGNRVLCPENTMAAFAQAIADGADILETDLHLSADGVFMCIHDATVDRTTDSSGPVAGMTLSELRRLSASCDRSGFEAQRIPTLAEVAGLLPADVALALELKTDRFLEAQVCQQLAAELDELGIRDRSVALSFSLARLRSLQAVAPDLSIGWITLSRAWPMRGVQLLGPLWPLLITNPLYPWLAHRSGQSVCPLDPTPDSRLWLYRRIGCDAVLSDDPGSTCRALGRKSRPAPSGGEEEQ
jgi:glycerophosphoryl diester phosphodiesterase